jgi:hypothetical protein
MVDHNRCCYIEICVSVKGEAVTSTEAEVISTAISGQVVFDSHCHLRNVLEITRKSRYLEGKQNQ